MPETLPASPSGLRFPWAVAACISLAYVGTGLLGLGMFITEGAATLVWAPTGIAIATLMTLGWRYAPAITAGAFVVNLAIGLSPPAAAVIAAGNTLEALIAYFLMRAATNERNPFQTVRGALLYMLLAGFVATQASALMGAATTVAAGIRPPDAFGKVWMLWFLGDAAGAILLAPMLYLLARRWFEHDLKEREILWGKTGRYREFVIVLVLSCGAAAAVYGPWLTEHVADHMSWLPFLFILWSARRFSPLGTVVASFFVSLTSIACIIHFGALLDKDTVNERLLYLYLFLFFQAGAALVTSAFVQERRALMREMVRTREEAKRASEQKTRFLANMSHEIRTPLNGIIGMASLMQEEIAAKEQRDRLQIIQSSAESLLNVLNDILDHARLESGKLGVEQRVFALRPLLRDVVGLFQPQAELKGIALHAQIDANLAEHVVGDETRVRQVLVNVLSNAVKFTDSGSVDVQVTTRADIVTFVVRDTGIGIPREALGRVLEAFTQADSSTTRRHGGSGLGLTISQQLVDRMEGRLNIDSDGMHGTTVTIRLPLPAAN